ncbi:MAG: glycosyltransferase family 4 protein, partial [Thermofilaceae archaeon]|nr:glycosyltransferase family 4 protein [Thermofilaceae archaeon]
MKILYIVKDFSDMKILYIVNGYYPRIGGVEYVVKSIAERLVKRGHDVTVIAGEPEAKEPHEEEVNGVSVTRWPTWSPGGAYHLPRSRKRLESLLKNELHDTNVVHIHSVHSILSVWSGLKVKREFNYKGELVITPHYHGTGHTLIRRTLWIP